MTDETGKQVAEMFYPKDWLGDDKLQRADLATQGAWINTLCYMWQHRLPFQKGSFEDFGRLWSCDVAEVKRICNMMKVTKLCTVRICRNGNVTLTCRRLLRRYRARLETNERVAKFREKQKCNDDVTPHARARAEDSCSSSSSCSSSKKEKERAGAFSPFKKKNSHDRRDIETPEQAEARKQAEAQETARLDSEWQEGNGLLAALSDPGKKEIEATARSNLKAQVKRESLIQPFMIRIEMLRLLRIKKELKE